MTTSWTQDDFPTMSWHDNHVHALRFVAGGHGSGDLVFDIDYITRWILLGGTYEVEVAPATLRFKNVADLQMSLDFRSFAFGPFSIDGIKRREERREFYTAQIWTLESNFPAGQLEFLATGFEQHLRASPVRSKEFCLHPEARAGGA